MLPVPPLVPALPVDHAIAVPADHERPMIRLFEAIDLGDAVFIETLLPRIENHWGLDADHDTVLIHAAREGALDVVERVLARGASPEMANRHGQTALWFAADRGHLAVVQRLASVVRPSVLDDKMGHTALMRAIVNDHEDVMQRLLTVSSVNQAAHDGITPLMLAVLNQRATMLEQLLDAGASLDAIANNGDTVFGLANAVGDPAIIAQLTRHQVRRERLALAEAVNDVPTLHGEISSKPRSRL